jgi:UPF0755 protein
LNIKKIISLLSIVVITGLIIYGFILIRQIFSENTKFAEKEMFVHIPTDSNYEDVKKIVAPFVSNLDHFEMVASKMSYPANVKAGRFLLSNQNDSQNQQQR